jgi:hypothetical protein
MKPRKEKRVACWGCTCGVELKDGYHREESYPGMVYVYPCSKPSGKPPRKSKELTHKHRYFRTASGGSVCSECGYIKGGAF